MKNYFFLRNFLKWLKEEETIFSLFNSSLCCDICKNLFDSKFKLKWKKIEIQQTKTFLSFSITSSQKTSKNGGTTCNQNTSEKKLSILIAKEEGDDRII